MFAKWQRINKCLVEKLAALKTVLSQEVTGPHLQHRPSTLLKPSQALCCWVFVLASASQLAPRRGNPFT